MHPSVLSPPIEEDLQRFVPLHEIYKNASGVCVYCSPSFVLQIQLAPPPFLDIEVRRDDISIIQQLGEGEFGPIYDAELKLDVNVLSRTIIKVLLDQY